MFVHVIMFSCFSNIGKFKIISTCILISLYNVRICIEDFIFCLNCLKYFLSKCQENVN